MKTWQVLLFCALAGPGYGHIVEKIIGDAKNRIKGLSGIVTGGLFGVLKDHSEEDIYPQPEEPPPHLQPENDGLGWLHRHKFHHQHHYHHHHHHSEGYERPNIPDYNRHEEPMPPFEASPPIYGHIPQEYYPGYQPNIDHSRPVYQPEPETQNPEYNTDLGYQNPGYNHNQRDQNHGNNKPAYEPDQGNRQHGYRPYQESQLPGYLPDQPSQQPEWNQPDIQQPESQNPRYQPDQGNYQPQYKPDQGNQHPSYHLSQGSNNPNKGEKPNINLEQNLQGGQKPGEIYYEHNDSGIPENAYRPENGANKGSSTANSFQNNDDGSTSRPSREDSPKEEDFELDVRSSFDDEKKTYR